MRRDESEDESEIEWERVREGKREKKREEGEWKEGGMRQTFLTCHEEIITLNINNTVFPSYQMSSNLISL